MLVPAGIDACAQTEFDDRFEEELLAKEQQRESGKSDAGTDCAAPLVVAQRGMGVVGQRGALRRMPLEDIYRVQLGATAGREGRGHSRRSDLAVDRFVGSEAISWHAPAQKAPQAALPLRAALTQQSAREIELRLYLQPVLVGQFELSDILALEAKMKKRSAATKRAMVEAQQQQSSILPPLV